MDNILIIDDLKDNLKVVEGILEESGYNTQIATSGKEGIKYCQNIDFDLFLIDVRMPELNGFETYQLIKQNSKNINIPALFFVAKTDYENIPKVFEQGGVDIISKPFQKNELLARVNSHLEIHKQRAQLMELNVTKDKFFSIIAHDLKNPFNVILAYSKELLKNHKKYDNEKREQLIKSVNNNANNAYKLLENLLTWSQSQNGVIKYLPNKIHLKILIFEIMFNLKEQADKKNIQVLDDISENELIYADGNMTAIVLRNLISNAIKFTANGGNIVISSEFQENSNFLEISVKDSGVGISKNKINDLFSIDKNTSTKGTENEKGTGLGLLLCKEFAERNGGKIWVESEVGKGSNFKFTVPIKNISNSKK